MLFTKLQHFWSRCWETWQSNGAWSAWSVGWRELSTATGKWTRSCFYKISSPIYRLICSLYYNLIFGRSVLGEKSLAAIVHALERRQQKGDIPVLKEVWDTQYIDATWDYLSNHDEVSRYSVIVGYIQHFKPAGSILDIGCGVGILQERLAAFGYARYVGLDISEQAIQQARVKEDAKTLFITGDAESYLPVESFDVIILNEVLYYFVSPVESFARYTKFLTATGIIVTSLFHTTRSIAIQRRIKEKYPALAETQITNTFKGFTWVCNVFAISKN